MRAPKMEKCLSSLSVYLDKLVNWFWEPLGRTLKSQTKKRRKENYIKVNIWSNCSLYSFGAFPFTFLKTIFLTST